MTHRMFDPINFSSYDAADCPRMLHFQYKGSEDVFRYVLVERIPIGDINTGTRRKVGEVGSESSVMEKYLEGSFL